MERHAGCVVKHYISCSRQCTNFGGPFIICRLQDYVMLSWNLVVFCLLAIVVIDLICVVSSSVIVGVV